jgi:hypothetical protein
VSDISSVYTNNLCEVHDIAQSRALPGIRQSPTLKFVPKVGG